MVIENAKSDQVPVGMGAEAGPLIKPPRNAFQVSICFVHTSSSE